MVDLSIYYTPSAQDLGTSIGSALSVQPHEIYVNQFPDSEWYIRLPEGGRSPNPILVHRLYPNQNDSLVQLLLVLSEFAERGQKVILVAPYIPYAKMHKRVHPGEIVSAKVLTGWLAQSTSLIITLDCHFIKRLGRVDMWGAHYCNLTESEHLLRLARERSRSPVVVSPDEGAQYMAGGPEDHQTLRKRRGVYEEGVSGFQRYSETEGILDVEGRDVYVLDDMISTGGTMAKAVSMARAAGASRVVAMATHGLFVRAADRKILDAGADEIVVSNTIRSPYSKLDILPVLVEELGKV